MSGHSKWSTIKRQKGAADAKRGQMFTKLSNAITIAVKEGGGITDPESNFKLRLAIDRARSINMPKETIERAIAKAKGVGADALSEAIYEGFAPMGVAVVVVAVTDNKTRTVAELKNVFEKNGGTLGSLGSVQYLFTQNGEIIIPKNGKTIDELFSIAVDAGADDVEEEDGKVILYTGASKLNEVRKMLESQSLTVESSELVFRPQAALTISDPEAKEKILNFLEKIEDLDDVQKVFVNANFE